MSAPLTAESTRELIRLVLAFWCHDPFSDGYRQLVDELRRELRRREWLPVAPGMYQLGRPLCEPAEDPFCDGDVAE